MTKKSGMVDYVSGINPKAKYQSVMWQCITLL